MRIFPAIATLIPLLSGTASGVTKQPIQGLVTMGSLQFNAKPGTLPNNSMEEINAHPGIYAGATINVFWSQLEPTRGVFDDSALTAALANITAYNNKYPSTPVVAKLRVHGGAFAPSWVITETGGPATIAGPQGNVQVGAFWSATYRAEWQALQNHLASEYDSSPAIAEVAVSSCASRTDEPFVISLDSTSLPNMRQIGFSDTAYMACLNGAAADYQAWTQTPLDFPFNSYRNSDACNAANNFTGCLSENTAFTLQVMNAFRSALGTARAVVSNHGLENPIKLASALPIYAQFFTLYSQAQSQSKPSQSPLEFQTVSQSVNWDASIQLALGYHPTELEIWDTVASGPGGLANLSTAQLQGYAAALKANLTSTGPSVFSAASLEPVNVAANSLFSIFGSGLATASGGTAVTVTDAAGLQQNVSTSYASPTQINALLPATVAVGPGTYTATPTGGTPVTGTFWATSIAPAIFTANSNGAGVPAAEVLYAAANGTTTTDNAFTCTANGGCVPKPITVKAGTTTYLILYGTGLRNVTSMANSTVVMGPRTVQPSFVGAQGAYPGLDQINVIIPIPLAGSGAINLVVTADGVPSNNVTIQIQ
jgi:hypothetical protein